MILAPIPVLSIPLEIGIATALGLATALEMEAVSIAVGASMDAYCYFANKTHQDTDDGGSIYFNELVAHTLNRMTTAMLIADTGKMELIFGFDHEAFLKNIGISKWNAKDGYAVEYEHNNYDSRTYKQDVSFSYMNLGVFVSCKIDSIRDNNTDDHIILAVLYNVHGQLVSAAAVLKMKNEDDVSIGTITYNEEGGLIQITSTGLTEITNIYDDLPDAVKGVLKSGMKAASHYSDYSDRRKDIPSLVKSNIKAMIQSIRPFK